MEASWRCKVRSPSVDGSGVRPRKVGGRRGPGREKNDRPLKVISSMGSILKSDPTDHLHSRRSQLLAYAYSVTPNAALLLHRTLEPTRRVFEHCYADRKYRWAFPYGYPDDDDLRNIGLEARTIDKLELADVMPCVIEHTERHEPVLFYAPRLSFPHWLTFMRSQSMLPDEYLLSQSFMVCGHSVDTEMLVLMDD